VIVFIKERSVFLLGHSWTDLDRKMGLFWTILGKSLIFKEILEIEGNWGFFVIVEFIAWK
jgi:hypothetical protein